MLFEGWGSAYKVSVLMDTDFMDFQRPAQAASSTLAELLSCTLREPALEDSLATGLDAEGWTTGNLSHS